MEMLSLSLAFMKQIHLSPVDSPHKGPAMLVFDISFIWTTVKSWVIGDSLTLDGCHSDVHSPEPNDFWQVFTKYSFIGY